MKTWFSIFLLVLLTTFLGCAAQTNLQRPSIQKQPLAPGDRVRVSVSDALGKQFFVGPLVALDADTLFLEGQTALPLSSVTKFQVSLGRKSNRNDGWFAFLGSLGGAVAGLYVGAAIGEREGDDAGDPLFSGLAGALLGVVVGRVVGARIDARIDAGNESWEEVPLERVRLRSLR